MRKKYLMYHYITFYIYIYIYIYLYFFHKDTLRARFTKQGKVVRERNSKTAPMGVEISAVIYWQRAD